MLKIADFLLFFSDPQLSGSSIWFILTDNTMHNYFSQVSRCFQPPVYRKPKKKFFFKCKGKCLPELNIRNSAPPGLILGPNYLGTYGTKIVR